MGLAGIGLGLTVLSWLIWIGLIGFWGQFWRADQRLEDRDGGLEIKGQAQASPPPPLPPSPLSLRHHPRP